MDNFNFEAEEKKAGRKAASTLTSALQSEIKSVFNRKSGEMENSNVRTRYKDGVLDRLVLSSPHYSFKQHFGSTKTGTTPFHTRSGTSVKSFVRHLEGMVTNVKAHERSSSYVRSHRKGIDYKSYNHISAALKATPALEVLATELGINRIVNITSQIDF